MPSVPTRLYRIWILVWCVLVVGCDQSQDNTHTRQQYDPFDNEYDYAWSEQNAEVYRVALRKQIVGLADSKVHFLTITPQSRWRENKDWNSIPQEEWERLELGKLFRPASEAVLKDGYVVEKGTNTHAWMNWVSVKKWVSSTKVIVEEGVWSGPLGGGGFVFLYEKIDGQWVRTEELYSWVS